MDARSPDRRSDPRRGIVVRVGSALVATGLMSAANDRRALTGGVPDPAMAMAFGLALALLVIASLRRPPRSGAWVALAATALVLAQAGYELAGAGGLAVALAYALLAATATRLTAEHLRPLMVAAFALWTPVLWLLRSPAAPGDHLLAPALWAAAALALGYTAYAVADPRRTHPSERLRRAGHGLLAIALVGASAARVLLVSGEATAAVDVLTLAGVGALAVLASVRTRPAIGGSLAAATGLVVFTLLGVVYLAGVPYHADAVVAPHRAAELLVAGEQPYAAFDLVEALDRFGLDPRLATHLADGEVLRTYSYPALSFLYLAPFVAAGLPDVRWLYFIAVVCIAVVAASAVRPAWRPIALATVVGSEVVMRQSILAGIDPLWALLVMGAWLARGSRWPCAVLLGLAVADRQPAWFVAPFLLVAVARQVGWREAAARGGIAVALALLVNAPFVLAAPERAIRGILAPIVAPLQADGVGLMQLGVTDRYTTVLPHLAYTVLAGGVLVTLLGVMWKRPRALAGGALAFAFVPLWFAWRSLQNYFAFVAPFALVADDEIANEQAAATTRADPPAPVRPSRRT